jgi:hypothetical protein
MSNTIEIPRKLTYQEWWNSPIETSCGYRINASNQIITNGNYVREFFNKVKNLVEKKGYEIKDEKQLKSEIATLIYNLSEDSL